jgi:hypothetical protein
MQGVQRCATVTHAARRIVPRGIQPGRQDAEASLYLTEFATYAGSPDAEPW